MKKAAFAGIRTALDKNMDLSKIHEKSIAFYAYMWQNYGNVYIFH